MYLSADIQNQLIQAMANEVLSEIVKEATSAKFFAVLVDKTSDISRQEQVSFVLRYVDNIQEHLTGMVTV